MSFVSTTHSFRIRLLEPKDLPDTRNMIMNGLYENFIPSIRIYFKRNFSFQIFLAVIAMVFVCFMDGDTWTFAASIGVLLLLFTIACAATTWWIFEQQRYIISKYHNISKNYVVFWVSEMLLDGDWKIVGSVALMEPTAHFSGAKTVALKNLSVSSKVRRKGIGEKLLKHAIHQAASLGYSELVLSTSEMQSPAISIYTKYGFRRLSKIVNMPLLFVLPGWNLHFFEKKLVIDGNSKTQDNMKKVQ